MCFPYRFEGIPFSCEFINYTPYHSTDGSFAAPNIWHKQGVQYIAMQSIYKHPDTSQREKGIILPESIQTPEMSFCRMRKHIRM